jgi:hypothetical protein
MSLPKLQPFVVGTLQSKVPPVYTNKVTGLITRGVTTTASHTLAGNCRQPDLRLYAPTSLDRTGFLAPNQFQFHQLSVLAAIQHENLGCSKIL